MNKLDLLKKLKALANDNRGNNNERESAEKQLNKLMEKYHITEEDIGIEEVKRRDLYFKTEWEQKLISQTLYKLFPGKPLYQQRNKRNWCFVELTDAEYLEFEMYYQAYKGSFQKEFELFYLAFVSTNDIYPENPPKSDESKPDKFSRGDRMRAAMMAQGIQRTQVRRQLSDGKNK